MVALEVVAQFARWMVLRMFRTAGTLMRLTSHGMWPIARWLILVAIALLVLPPLINAALDLAEVFGVWSRLGVDETPSVGDWWTPERVLLIATGLLALKWLLRARERVVVEEFMDYTSSDAKAVSGLAVLLVTDLSRLRELYGRVNEQLSTPASVGAGAGWGSAASTDPGAFLSVRADDITEVLSGAVASESKVTVGGVTIPIGLVFSLVGRLARGPRVLGSVHLTDAGGGPTLTAQIVGRGRNFTWRVDAPEREAGTPAKAFLDPMVTEIACRMFTDMTLRGSVRWQAIRAFTAYLELYWESLRTPKNRATFLKRAEGKLLEAVAEDETFDLAFYNLGVVYSQLAQTEYAAADAAEYPHKQAAAPDAAHRARTESALVAFRRAIALRRDRWEAIYALAVHEYARVEKKDRSSDDKDRRYHLMCIVRRCERVLELDPRNAQACDLMGMAYLKLGDCRRASRSHHAAVHRSWRRLCRAEYAERRTPPTGESILPSASANAAAALHNLAQAHWERAELRPPGLRRRLRLVRADRVFHQALRLAPTNSRAAMEFERGRMREGRLSYGKAVESYLAAIRVEPENPLYWAHKARAQAKSGDGDAEARRSAASALEELAPSYRRSLEPHCLPTVLELCERTLDALEDTYAGLKDKKGRLRMRAIRELRVRIIELERPPKPRRPQPQALLKLLPTFGREEQFEREQVWLALARTLGALERWDEAADQYEALITELEDEESPAIRQHALYAKRAKALRRSGQKQKALDAAARALVINPISPVARRELGKAHFALLQYEEALEAWQHTLWLTPNDATLHWKAAFSLWSVAQDRQEVASRRGALTDAAAKFEQAAILFGIENLNGWAWSQLWLGRTWAELDDADRAVKHLRAAKGCGTTELPARLLLGEVYQASRDFGLSAYQLAKAEELCLTKPRDRDELGDKVDADWGETLTFREVLARVQLGLAHCAAEAANDEVEARKLARAAYGLADEITGQPRARSLIQAHALALEAELDFAEASHDANRLERALVNVGRAARLAPAPDILLRQVQLTEALVQAGATGARRAQLIACMIDDVRAIRRIDGDDGDLAREGELILRRWKAPVVSANGNGASLN